MSDKFQNIMNNVIETGVRNQLTRLLERVENREGFIDMVQKLNDAQYNLLLERLREALN